MTISEFKINQPPARDASILRTEGNTNASYHDPMIAKVITRDIDRDNAINRALEAGEMFAFAGVETNIAFANQILGGRTVAQWGHTFGAYLRRARSGMTSYFIDL